MSTYLACRDILTVNFCATVPNSTLTYILYLSFFEEKKCFLTFCRIKNLRAKSSAYLRCTVDHFKFLKSATKISHHLGCLKPSAKLQRIL